MRINRRNVRDMIQVTDQSDQIKIPNKYIKSNNTFFFLNSIRLFFIQLYQQTDNQPIINPCNSQTTSYRINSATTNTLHDDQSSSLNMTPILSIPIEQRYSSTLDTTKNSKTDFDQFFDGQLQSTLEKYLNNSLLSSKENCQQKSKSVTLTKSETDTLIENCSFSKPKVPNLEHYEKQV